VRVCVRVFVRAELEEDCVWTKARTWVWMRVLEALLCVCLWFGIQPKVTDTWPFGDLLLA